MIFVIIHPSVFENWAKMCPKTHILAFNWPPLAYLLKAKATKRWASSDPG